MTLRFTNNAFLCTCASFACGAGVCCESGVVRLARIILVLLGAGACYVPPNYALECANRYADKNNLEPLLWNLQRAYRHAKQQKGELDGIEARLAKAEKAWLDIKLVGLAAPGEGDAEKTVVKLLSYRRVMLAPQSQRRLDTLLQPVVQALGAHYAKETTGATFGRVIAQAHVIATALPKTVDKTPLTQFRKRRMEAIWSLTRKGERAPLTAAIAQCVVASHEPSARSGCKQSVLSWRRSSHSAGAVSAGALVIEAPSSCEPIVARLRSMSGGRASGRLELVQCRTRQERRTAAKKVAYQDDQVKSEWTTMTVLSQPPEQCTPQCTQRDEFGLCGQWTKPQQAVCKDSRERIEKQRVKTRKRVTVNKTIQVPVDVQVFSATVRGRFIPNEGPMRPLDFTRSHESAAYWSPAGSVQHSMTEKSFADWVVQQLSSQMMRMARATRQIRPSQVTWEFPMVKDPDPLERTLQHAVQGRNLTPAMRTLLTQSLGLNAAEVQRLARSGGPISTPRARLPIPSIRLASGSCNSARIDKAHKIYPIEPRGPRSPETPAMTFNGVRVMGFAEQSALATADLESGIEVSAHAADSNVRGWIMAGGASPHLGADARSFEVGVGMNAGVGRGRRFWIPFMGLHYAEQRSATGERDAFLGMPLRFSYQPWREVVIHVEVRPNWLALKRVFAPSPKQPHYYSPYWVGATFYQDRWSLVTEAGTMLGVDDAGILWRMKFGVHL